MNCCMKLRRFKRYDCSLRGPEAGDQDATGRLCKAKRGGVINLAHFIEHWEEGKLSLLY